MGIHRPRVFEYVINTNVQLLTLAKIPNREDVIEMSLGLVNGGGYQGGRREAISKSNR